MSDVKSPVVDTSESPSRKKKLTMHIKIHSPFKTYFNEDAYSISALNNTGPFDILPKHHNFMTLLNPCELVIDRLGGPIRIRIARGIMRVKQDEVVVFLDV